MKKEVKCSFVPFNDVKKEMKRQKLQTKVPIFVCIYLLRLPIQITISQDEMFLNAHVT